MKPKEWLYKNGHIEKADMNRRGRMSLAHKALIEAAVAAGEKIDGYAVTSKPAIATDKPVTVERVAVEANRMLDCPDPLRDARDFAVVDKATGKPIHAVGPANICNGCRNSFTYCPCENPRVWLDHERETVVRFSYNNR